MLCFGAHNPMGQKQSIEEIPMEEILCVLEGRADGIFTEEGLTTVDEIKGVYRDLDKIGEPVGVHLAQAMCYGYFWCLEKGLSSIGLQLTYCQIETEEIRRFRRRGHLRSWSAGSGR